MNAHEVIQDASQYLMHTYKRDLLLVSGQGCTVFDSDGNSYLDLVGGIACCTIGHSNPTLLTYFKSQDHKLLNPSNQSESIIGISRFISFPIFFQNSCSVSFPVCQSFSTLKYAL